MLEGPFAATSANTGVPQNSREELVNMYAEAEASGISKLVRRQRPGLRSVYSVGGIKRGIEEFTHGTYLVIRNVFYRWNGTTLTQLGLLNTNIGSVTMITDDNGNVFVSDNATGYHYDAGTGIFDVVVTPSAVGTCAFQGGFGIYAEPNTGRFYKSALNDLTSWDALDFATAEGSPDEIVRVFVDHNEIWFFGASTVELWRNNGAQDFPFVPNTQMERGCLAAFSIAADDNSIFWLGDDQIVYRADGYRPVRVSTHAIEEWILNAPNKDEGRAFIYTERGHKFYVLTFPDYGTKQFNVATGLWNTCQSWGEAEWQIIGGAGKAVSYYATPSGIVTLDSSLNQDEGGVMERAGISAPVFNNGDLMTLSAMWLNCEVGTGNVNDPEPQVMLQIARNGGPFGNEMLRSIGATGNYIRRAIWRNLGQARQFVAKFSFTDNAKFTVMSVFGDIS